MSTYKALLSVFSTDRVGLISDITGTLFDLGINLEDTSFAVLGSGGGLTSILEVPEDLTTDEVAERISTLPGFESADVDVKRMSLPIGETPPTSITHRIRCEGQDQPGLIARLTEVFIDFDANIIRLKSDLVEQDGQDHFITRFSVNIPDNKADACLITLGNITERLGQKLTYEKVN